MSDNAKEQIYEICFQIISAVGTACSNYMEALSEAKTGAYEAAESLIQKGDEFYSQGHKAHVNLIQEEAGGKDIPLNLMLLHSEDQMMRTEVIKTMAEEFIELYKKLDNKSRSVSKG